MNDPSPDCECGHDERLHHATPSGRFPCAHVRSGTSTRGIIGLPYSHRCECESYRPASERAQVPFGAIPPRNPFRCNTAGE